MFAVLKTIIPKRCPHVANPDGVAIESQGINFGIRGKKQGDVVIKHAPKEYLGCHLFSLNLYYQQNCILLFMLGP